jgi:hypothetical protein
MYCTTVKLNNLVKVKVNHNTVLKNIFCGYFLIKNKTENLVKIASVKITNARTLFREKSYT